MYIKQLISIMEKRLNTKIEQYISSFKSGICEKISEMSFTEQDKVGELLGYIYDYNRLTVIKEDLIKRKRVKNAIPVSNRCNAKRANGEQCTRRRKDEEEYCGTHTKGTPHGIIGNNMNMNDSYEKNIDVYATEIMGIVYYIDNFKNVYNTEDVMKGVQNPRIIAEYKKQNDIISIPSLGVA